ncbi:hypothetical protein GT030_10480 [Streptomyces sp. SID1328]|uniref:hypothetical protein n=1 Tax=Streptomyces sp. SID1328 TaxID=2690250 RepID=UPI00136A50B5|nr:hypothetical protein [Streptomyces sp. SID1328]MYV39290.1 hypothetical protein [Streptomyces sp. SID1328]
MRLVVHARAGDGDGDNHGLDARVGGGQGGRPGAARNRVNSARSSKADRSRATPAAASA